MPGIDALREEVQAERHEADVAGALAVAEEAAFDPLAPASSASSAAATPQPRSLCGCTDSTIASRRASVRRHPFDLVGVDVRRRHLDRRRQVDDHLARGVGCQTSLTASQTSTAKSSSVPVKLSGEYSNIHSVSGRAAAQSRISFAPDDRDVDDAGAVEPEHDAPLHRRRRVVEVDDRALDARERLERAADDRLARLRQHLDRHVVGNQILVDQLAREVEVGLRRRRKADLDFLVAHLHEQLEHAQLALGIHRLDQRLVAVAQVDAAPDGRRRDRARRPLPVGQRDGGEGPVLAGRIDGHGSLFEARQTMRNRPPVPGGRLSCAARIEGMWVICARGAAAAEAAREGGRREGARDGRRCGRCSLQCTITGVPPQKQELAKGAAARPAPPIGDARQEAGDTGGRRRSFVHAKPT